MAFNLRRTLGRASGVAARSLFPRTAGLAGIGASAVSALRNRTPSSTTRSPFTTQSGARTTPTTPLAPLAAPTVPPVGASRPGPGTTAAASGLPATSFATVQNTPNPLGVAPQSPTPTPIPTKTSSLSGTPTSAGVGSPGYDATAQLYNEGQNIQSGNVDAAVTSSADYNAPSTSTSGTSSPSGSITTPQANSIIDALRARIGGLSAPGSEEQALTDELAQFRGDSASKIAGLAGQGRGITAGLVRGQQEKEQTQDNLQEQTLMDRIAGMSAQRQAELTAASNEYNIAAAEQARQDALTAPTTVGNSILRFNPTTGQYETLYTAPNSGLDPTTDIQEYEYAKQNGYTGSFTDYQAAQQGSGNWMGSSVSAYGRPKDSKYLTDAGKLYDDFAANPVVSGFAKEQEGAQYASSFNVNTTNPSEDQALIFSFMKVLDPGSVVREGEYATAQKNASVLERFGVNVDQMLNGTGLLSADQRKNIVAALQNKYVSDQQNYQGIVDQFTSRAQSYGVDPSDVVLSYSLSGTSPGNSAQPGVGADLSGYQPDQQYLNALQNSKDASGTPLTAEDIDTLARYVTLLKQQGKTVEEVNAEIRAATGFNSAERQALNSSAQSPVNQPESTMRKVTQNYPVGSWGSQCGRFTNRLFGLKMGNSIESKLAYTDPKIKIPRPGDFFVMPYSWTGHTGAVARTVFENGVFKGIYALDSNWHKNEKVDYHFIPASKITAYGRTPIKTQKVSFT